MTFDFSLHDVDTRNYRAVAFAIVQAFHKAYPDADSSYITRIISDVKNMFWGEFDNLQRIDTRYHDLEHTMQASLCFTRLMVNRALSKDSPRINENAFKIGLVSILLHDTGYLKRDGDEEGTGAKYTRIHERRSCEYAGQYLLQFDWAPEWIAATQNMISCTGPFADIPNVPFNDEIEQILGAAVCTADYVGQMSDPAYVSKLYHLYEEFEESDDFNEVPQNKRGFKDFTDLLQKTPKFWEEFVQPKLHVECKNLVRYLAAPYPDGPNPYLHAIGRNIALVEKILAEYEGPYDSKIEDLAKAIA